MANATLKDFPEMGMYPDVARLYRISPSTAKAKVKARLIPCLRLHGAVRFPRELLVNHLTELYVEQLQHGHV